MNTGLVLLAVGLGVDLVCYILNRVNYKRAARIIKASPVSGCLGGFITYLALWVVSALGAAVAFVGLLVLLAKGG